jgi:hypothetical protein
VPGHVARLVTRIVAQFVVDYCASRRLVVDNSTSCRLDVDYFASAVRSGASARRADRHADRRVARVDYIAYAARLGGSARRVVHRLSSTTSPTPRDRVPRHAVRLITRLVAPLVVDYFVSAVRPGASARRAARHADRRVARRRLLRLAQARRRLLRLAQAHRRQLRLAQARH